MKSIREKAEEYGNNYPFRWHENGYECENTASASIAYEEGANAVLEEIEAIIEPIIESTDEGVLDEDDRYYDENITAIYNKIKELKG